VLVVAVAVQIATAQWYLVQAVMAVAVTAHRLQETAV
jgi:hypothetical protein